MKKPVPAPIESLFQRYPALSGFSVRGLDEIPDNCARSGDDEELFVSDIGIAPTLTSEEYGEIFQEIAATLADLLAEQPEVTALLRGRTFARTLH
jgi:phosphotransacetylase